MSDGWMYAGEDDTEYVVYRTGFPSGALEYLKETQWDNYVIGVPDHRCEFISRGHTLTEAINLTKLANEGE